MWIEILISETIFTCQPLVTSHAEVWIEITLRLSVKKQIKMSPPMRRCGLKFLIGQVLKANLTVTSHAEVWIEILPPNRLVNLVLQSHLPCGGVD